MPAKRKQEDSDSESASTSSDDDDQTTTGTEDSTESEGSEEHDVRPTASNSARPTAKPAPSAATGKSIANRPHDEEFVADEFDRDVRTPPQKAGSNSKIPVGKVSAAPAPAPANVVKAGSNNSLRNMPHDESFDVDGDHHATPRGGASSVPQPKKAPNVVSAKSSSGSLGKQISNDHTDEEFLVDDDRHVATPPGTRKTNPQPQGGQPKAAPQSQASPSNNMRKVSNQHFDEEFDAVGTDHSSPVSSQNQHSPPKNLPDDDTEESSSEDDVPKGFGNHGGNLGGVKPDSVQPNTGTPQPVQNIDYNPNDYAFLNNKVSREVRDLFAHILAYQPTVLECPTKFRPFIPDFMPSVGDIDTFCKVTRPDAKPDELGLVVVDEPASNQSNPAVVKIGLQYTLPASHQQKAVFVDSVEDAHNRPQVVDKWIQDIKEIHAKKPLPTVQYTKPMPDIEKLLQVWPHEFEEFLATDAALPPPTVDLDIDQYVRMLCALLDIPAYSNLIESLHVMFTLYLEFRANQHFQHT